MFGKLTLKVLISALLLVGLVGCGVKGALVIMIVAVVVSVIIMMLFAVPVGRFVNKHPKWS